MLKDKAVEFGANRASFDSNIFPADYRDHRVSAKDHINREEYIRRVYETLFTVILRNAVLIIPQLILTPSLEILGVNLDHCIFQGRKS